MKWIVSATVVFVLVVGGTRSVCDSGGHSPVITDFKPVRMVPPDSVWDSRGRIYSGFLTGNTFRERTRDEKLHYVMGYLDAMMSASLFGAPHWFASEILSCTVGMDNVQVLAIVEKYLDDHPEHWHLPMNALVFNAFRDVCEKEPQTDSEN